MFPDMLICPLCADSVKTGRPLGGAAGNDLCILAVLRCGKASRRRKSGFSQCLHCAEHYCDNACTRHL